MEGNRTFSIESEPGRHILAFNGQEIGTFGTLEAAEREAGELARQTIPGVELHFELDFQWTLSNLEIRVATLEDGGPVPIAAS